MAKIQKVLLKSFNDESVKDFDTATVPQGSIFRKVTVMHEGIMAWYEVPEVDVIGERVDRFKIVANQGSIPENAEFIDLLDVIVETGERNKETGEAEQGIVVYPIYKLL